MTIYAGQVFEMAASQLKVVADHLDIPMDERDRLLFRSGRSRVLSNPPQRRHYPSVDIGDVVALAIWTYRR